MKIKDSARRLHYQLSTTARAAWMATDNVDRLFFPGWALVVLGAYLRFGSGVSLLVGGSLLILAVRPIRGWFL